MARWTLCWFLFIVLTTVGAYSGTNALIASHAADDQMNLAIQPLGELESPVCAQATRALLAAGAGSSPTATAEQRMEWTHAAQAVLFACGHA